MDYYNQKAQNLLEIYQSVDPSSLHSNWSKHLPHKPELALDVGSGSGRDAIWLAKKGWEIVAVEPAVELANLGRKYTEGYKVSWINDRLPGLRKLSDSQGQFSLILVIGVFMHLSCGERLASLRTLEGLMARDSIMAISLRHGPDTEGRGFYQVNAEEIVEFAKTHALKSEVHDNLPDELGRTGVTWQTVLVTKRGER